MEKPERILGIDVGLNGAIVCLDIRSRKFLVCEKFPVKIKRVENKRKSKAKKPKLFRDEKMIDYDALNDLFLLNNDWGRNCKAFVEQVGSMPNQGVASMFKFGEVYGSLKMICTTARLDMNLVTPKTWQPSVLSRVPSVPPKAAAKTKAKMAFDFYSNNVWDTNQTFRMIDHDGVIDAALIAEYGAQMVEAID